MDVGGVTRAKTTNAVVTGRCGNSVCMAAAANSHTAVAYTSAPYPTKYMESFVWYIKVTFK
jgi:hypothetical protein